RLHWHVMWQCWHWTDDCDFWSRAIPIRVADSSATTLDPASQLVHVCWHGLRRSEVPAVRWVADAFMLTSRTARLDWDHVLGVAEKYRLGLRFYNGLRYLRDAVDAPIPSPVLEQLKTIAKAWREALGERLVRRPTGPRTNAEIVRTLRHTYSWFTSDVP